MTKSQFIKKLNSFKDVKFSNELGELLIYQNSYIYRFSKSLHITNSKITERHTLIITTEFDETPTIYTSTKFKDLIDAYIEFSDIF